MSTSAVFAYQSRALSNSLVQNVYCFIESAPWFMSVHRLLKNLITNVQMNAKMKNFIRSTLTANRELKLKLKILVNVSTDNAIIVEMKE